MPNYHQVISVAVLAVLIGGLWISTFSMKRRLRAGLEGMELSDWTIRSQWFLTSARGEGLVSGKKVIVELVGTVQLVLRIAVECRTRHSARMIPPAWFTKIFPMKYSARSRHEIIVIARDAADRHFARELADSEEGAVLLTSLFHDSSANLLWFGGGSLIAFFRRPARQLLAPQGLKAALSLLLAAASLVERAAAPIEEVLSEPVPPAGADAPNLS